MKPTTNRSSILYNVKECFLYLVFGGLTTVLSVFLYWLFTRVLDLSYYSANILSWIGAVSFAYVTNKVIVFSDKGAFLKKAVAFFAARIFSLAVEMVVMYIMIELICVNDFASKIIVQAIVIILNYLSSKFAVFKNVR